MLLNFWRLVHLEGAAEYEQIVAPDMTVGEPSTGSPVVLWHFDDRLAVGDWGICDEITFHQLARGADLRALGYEVERDDVLYHAASRQAFIWPYDDRARLVGEHLYEDKTSLQIEEVSPDEAITPTRVREIHREQLAKLEAERGDSFWVLEQVA